MLTEESDVMKSQSPEYVKDVDTIFNQAVSAGSTVLDPVSD
jgi:hypothetical protein